MISIEKDCAFSQSTLRGFGPALTVKGNGREAIMIVLILLKNCTGGNKHKMRVQVEQEKHRVLPKL